MTAAMLASSATGAIDAADTCVSKKMQTAGKYLACRLKAESKGVLKSLAPDFSKCDAKFSSKWASIEAAAGGACPTTGDADGVQGIATVDTGLIAGTVAATARFVSNPDGTTFDVITGLTWEDKEASGTLDLHSVNNHRDAADVGLHLAALNMASFGGYNDWRLPTVGELISIVNFATPSYAYPAFDRNCTGICAVPACNCAFTPGESTRYFTAQADVTDPGQLVTVDPSNGNPAFLVGSNDDGVVMAVRGPTRGY